MAHIQPNLITFFQTIAGNVILFLSARGARVVKMASTQGKSFCVIQYAKTNSVKTPQREFREIYRKYPT
jgi:hypothetical protein